MPSEEGRSAHFEFYREVSRAGYELGCRQGNRAHLIARSLAARASAAGDVEGATFWRAVYRSIVPREAS